MSSRGDDPPPLSERGPKQTLTRHVIRTMLGIVFVSSESPSLPFLNEAAAWGGIKPSECW